jgi:hypothetical protein
MWQKHPDLDINLEIQRDINTSTHPGDGFLSAIGPEGPTVCSMFCLRISCVFGARGANILWSVHLLTSSEFSSLVFSVVSGVRFFEDEEQSCSNRLTRKQTIDFTMQSNYGCLDGAFLIWVR